MTGLFTPTNHGFLKLDFMFPSGVQVYEHACDGIDQTSHDKMRLNTYLSQDGEFVTVWWGLIDAHMTQLSLGFDGEPDFRFSEQYQEDLFRGYIPDDTTGTVILRALRFDRRTPNILSVTKDGKLECNALARTV